MIRPIRLLVSLGCLCAVSLSGQTLAPITTGAITAKTVAAGQSITVDLTGNFGFDGVTGQLVRWETVFGNFDVEMLPTAAPNHVTNFLAYAGAGDYDNTFIHRVADLSVQGTPAIVQGGLYKSVIPPVAIATRGSVNLEYNLPNARGTLAAARTSELNSASSQWYFNTSDNSTVLDTSNGGGYTVFARVISGGMTTVDRMAAITRFNVDGGVFSEIPLRFYSNGTITTANFVTINKVYPIAVYPTASAPGALTFSASSSNPAKVTASVVNGALRLTGVAGGTATITVTATDATTAAVSQQFNVTVQGPFFTQQPMSRGVSAGSSAALSVVVEGATPSYQWYRQRSGGPQAIVGATSATLTLANVQAEDMGFYFVRATAEGQTVDSATAIVTLSEGTSQLVNLSTRGSIPAGGNLTPGFVLKGDGNKALVVRSVGPRLLDFGVTDALLDPTMAIIAQGASIPVVSNNNWGDASNAAALIAASATLGAFPLTPASLDAAVLTELPLPNAQANRGYTVRISSTSSTAAGVALAEVYDPQAIGAGAKLVNVSALGKSGPGSEALVPGFVIGGTGAKTMLVRVVGPSLASFGVVGTMVDPRLSIVPLGQSFEISQNDNWSGSSALQSAFDTVGAFGFADTNSKDAAVVVRLPPGGYTVKVEGADGESGVVLVEAYDLDP